MATVGGEAPFEEGESKEAAEVSRFRRIPGLWQKLS